MRYRSIMAACGWCVALAGIGGSRLSATEPSRVERTVELFTAMEAGEIDTHLIAPSAHQVYVRINNKTNDILTIRLPDSFGAVPILAQFQPNGPGVGLGLGGPGLGGPGLGLGPLGAGGFQGAGGRNQSLGGGFGGNNQFIDPAMGLGNPGMGNPGIGNPGMGNRQAGGLFRVLPGRTGKVRAETVCLEHGKPDPNSRVKYALVPLNKLSPANECVQEICKLLGNRTISQPVAQAAAWHKTDQLSWEKLSRLNRSESRYTGSVKFFSEPQLQAAQLLVEQLDSLYPQSSPTHEGSDNSLSSVTSHTVGHTSVWAAQ